MRMVPPGGSRAMRFIAIDAITRQQRPALERVRLPPAVAGGMLPTSQGLGILLHPGERTCNHNFVIAGPARCWYSRPSALAAQRRLRAPGNPTRRAIQRWAARRLHSTAMI